MNVGGVNPNGRQSGQVRRIFISSVLNRDIIATTLRMAILVKLNFNFYSAWSEYVSLNISKRLFITLNQREVTP